MLGMFEIAPAAAESGDDSFQQPDGGADESSGIVRTLHARSTSPQAKRPNSPDIAASPATASASTDASHAKSFRSPQSRRFSKKVGETVDERLSRSTPVSGGWSMMRSAVSTSSALRCRLSEGAAARDSSVLSQKTAGKAASLHAGPSGDIVAINNFRSRLSQMVPRLIRLHPLLVFFFGLVLYVFVAVTFAVGFWLDGADCFDLPGPFSFAEMFWLSVHTISTVCGRSGMRCMAQTRNTRCIRPRASAACTRARAAQVGFGSAYPLCVSSQLLVLFESYASMLVEGIVRAAEPRTQCPQIPVRTACTVHHRDLTETTPLGACVLCTGRRLRGLHLHALARAHPLLEARPRHQHRAGAARLLHAGAAARRTALEPEPQRQRRRDGPRATPQRRRRARRRRA